MKRTLILSAALTLLAGCAADPETRLAVSAATSQLGVSAIDALYKAGKSPVAVSQKTHDLMQYGCTLFANQKDAFTPLIEVYVSKLNIDQPNPITAEEIVGYVGVACSVLDQLPIKKEDDIVPAPAASPGIPTS